MIRGVGLVTGFAVGPTVALILWLTLWSHDYALWDTNVLMVSWVLLPAGLTAVALAWSKLELRLPLALSSGVVGFVLTYFAFIVWAAGSFGS